MDQEKSSPMFMSNNTGLGSSTLFSGSNLIIILLIALLIFSSLGINIFIVFGNFLQTIVNLFGPLISQILSIFGYTAGTIIGKSADIITDTTKVGVEIAGGAVHSVGDLLKDASRPNIDNNSRNQLDKTINLSGIKNHEPKPDSTVNPIQNPITSGKQNWCLVGEYQGKRGCIAVSESDKCLSGQIFPTQQMCLNPTLSRG